MLNGNSMQSGPDSTAKKPKPKLPKGYGNEAEFLQEMRELFYDDVQSDRLNREAALEDLRFCVGDQWDDLTRQRREASRKPVLTINRLPAFLAQVIGARRQNETSIKIVADNGGTHDAARVREGIIRNVQKVSRAENAYDNALLGAVACGIGNFGLELRNTTDDIWTQELAIEKITDHLAVVWDRMLVEQTGADAGHCFVIEHMTKKDFFKRWPWATPADVITDISLRGDLRMTGWIAIDDVRVVNYWRMRTMQREFALLVDGSTVDITDLDADKPEHLNTLANIYQNQDGTPMVREVTRKYAQMYVCSGLDVLEGPYELPIDRIPVFRVPGWELRVGDWNHRWGLARFLKDPQRLHNYFRSVVAEKLMQTPRGVWTAADTAVQGREAQWRNSHLSDDPLLVWNGASGQEPKRVPPAIVEDAFIAQAEMTNQDIKDVSNIHEANLGMPSNEVSGAAIQARIRVSDTGTIIYHDNLTKAIAECGRVANELIPIVYDTPRIVKILGEDGKESMQAINDMASQTSTDITVGKYSVTATTGTSYETKRQEAAQVLMSLANAMPQVFQLAPDLLVEAMDFPLADKLAARFRRTLPPGVLGPDEQTPETAQKEQKAQQGQQLQEQLTIATAKSKLAAMDSQTQLNYSRAKNFEAEAEATPQSMANASANSASQVADRELRGRLETIKVAEGA